MKRSDLLEDMTVYQAKIINTLNKSAPTQRQINKAFEDMASILEVWKTHELLNVTKSTKKTPVRRIK